MEPYFDLMGLPTLNLPASRVLEWLASVGVPLSRFAVNLGAKTGHCVRRSIEDVRCATERRRDPRCIIAS